MKSPLPPAQPLSQSPRSRARPRTNFFWPDARMRDRFKQLAKNAGTTVSARLAELASFDLQFLQEQGRPLNRGDVVPGSPPAESSDDLASLILERRNELGELLTDREFKRISEGNSAAFLSFAKISQIFALLDADPARYPVEPNSRYSVKAPETSLN